MWMACNFNWPHGFISVPTPIHFTYFSSKWNGGGVGTGSAELLLQDVKAATALLQFYQLCFTAENSWKSCRSQEGIEKGKLREKFLAFSLLSLPLPHLPSSRLCTNKGNQPCTKCSRKGQCKNNWVSRLSLAVSAISGYFLQHFCRYIFFR